MVTQETFELFTAGDESRVVETVPGWTHDITNVGSDEMVVMLWVNEIFDREKPDTIAMKVDDIDATLTELREKGIRLVGDPGPGNPVKGQVFIHPSVTGGVLTQLVQR